MIATRCDPAGAVPRTSDAWWRAALLLAAGLFVARLVYLVWLCPYELTGDEAHYWEWSRRPALSYYTKGPGVAWTIWLGARVLGPTPEGVRLAAVVASLVSTLAIAAIARDASRGDGRIAFMAAAAFNLVAGYQATALLMTIDGPYVACWLVASWCALRVWLSLEKGRLGGAWWLGLGAALGVGFLYKYTILLLLPGLVAFAIARRSRLSVGRMLPGATAALAVALAAASPVIIWNHREGWPTVRHLMGHMKMQGGDMAPRVGPAFSVLWPLEFLGAQVGIVGPFALVLIVASLAWAWRRRRDDAAIWDARLLLAAMGLPVILFYVVVCFLTQAEGNWPIAGYATLLVIAVQFAAAEVTRMRELDAKWLAMPEPRPKWGLLRRRPETLGQVAWHWMIGWGLAAAVLLHAMPLAAGMPGLGKVLPLGRLTGSVAQARRVDALRHEVRQRTGAEPFLVGDRYQRASLLAFYVPGQPIVRSAGHQTGDRPTAYDYFADTRWDDSTLMGRPAILVGGLEAMWHKAFVWESLEQAWAPPAGDRAAVLWVAKGFGGLREPKKATR